MMYWGYGSGWGSVFMAVWMVLFWALVIGAAVLAIRAIGRSSNRTPPQRDPQQILAERFARGEIDETEYQQRLSALRGNFTPAR